MKVIRVALLVAVSVPYTVAAQAPVAASCRAAEAFLRELAVPALEQRERAEALRHRADRAEAEQDALSRRFYGSADSLVSVLVGPAVADSLRSERLWLNLSDLIGMPEDPPARKDSLARATSLMDDRIRLLVGSVVADSMAAATDSSLAAADRYFGGDETGSIPTFQDTRWAGLNLWRGALEDSLRQHAQAAPPLAAFEADSTLARRVLAPAFAAARRASELVNELFSRWLRAEELANLAEFDLEWDANELGGYARRVSIAVEFRGAAAGCRSCPALTAVGDAWRLVDDQLPDDVSRQPAIPARKRSRLARRAHGAQLTRGRCPSCRRRTSRYESTRHGSGSTARAVGPRCPSRGMPWPPTVKVAVPSSSRRSPRFAANVGRLGGAISATGSSPRSTAVSRRATTADRCNGSNGDNANWPRPLPPRLLPRTAQHRPALVLREREGGTPQYCGHRSLRSHTVQTAKVHTATASLSIGAVPGTASTSGAKRPTPRASCGAGGDPPAAAGAAACPTQGTRPAPRVGQTNAAARGSNGRPLAWRSFRLEQAPSRRAGRVQRDSCTSRTCSRCASAGRPGAA